jgi:thiamine-monophosphate kinase
MNLASIGETGFLTRLAKRLNIGDDAAILPFIDKDILLCCDTSVEGLHFDQRFFSPCQIGYRAIACAVSDIAAMGGLPLYALIAISLPPSIDIDLVDELYSGIYDLAESFNIKIVGGDTTASDRIVITATILGEAKRPVKRSGARPGDLIGVTGRLGGASAGLRFLREGVAGAGHLKMRYLAPVPRIEEGRRISLYATSMIDISDGLIMDLFHLSISNKKGVAIERERIPVADGADVEDALYGGDDYELLFTFKSESLSEIEGVGATVIGEVIDGEGVFLDGKEAEIRGYNHFKD